MSALHPYPASQMATLLMRRANRAIADRLQAAGWSFALTDAILPAGGLTNPYTRQIVFRVSAKRMTQRDRYYRAPHEMIHALDFEADKPFILLAGILGIERSAAQEALAEAGAYQMRHTASVRSWILGSIVWHVRRRPHAPYRWSDVRRPATRELAAMLIRGPGKPPGQFFAWSGDHIVRRPE